MKPLPALLLVSVGLNIWFVAKPPTNATTSIHVVSQTPSNVGQTVGLSEETQRLLGDARDEDLERLRDRLLAEGLPAELGRDIIKNRLWTEMNATIDATDPAKRRPWWQQTQERLPGEDIVMGRFEERLRNDYTVRVRELFPEEPSHTAIPDSTFLSESKRHQLQQLADDYDALRLQLQRETGYPYPDESERAKFDFLAAEKTKDMQALLSPAEYDELELRKTDSRQDLKVVAATLNLSEGEFRTLLAIEQWGLSEYPKPVTNDPFAPLSPEQAAKYEEIQRLENEQRLALLGEDRLFIYTEIKTGNYGRAARTIAWLNQPLEKTRDYMLLLHQATVDLTRLKKGPQLQPSPEVSRIAAKYEQSLVKLLGPDALDSNLPLALFLKSQREVAVFAK